MLAGLRVVDCSGESGWLAGKILGDLGADVVKVEPPGGGCYDWLACHARSGDSDDHIPD